MLPNFKLFLIFKKGQKITQRWLLINISISIFKKSLTFLNNLTYFIAWNESHVFINNYTYEKWNKREIKERIFSIIVIRCISNLLLTFRKPDSYSWALLRQTLVLWEAFPRPLPVQADTFLISGSIAKPLPVLEQ